MGRECREFISCDVVWVCAHCNGNINQKRKTNPTFPLENKNPEEKKNLK